MTVSYYQTECKINIGNLTLGVNLILEYKIHKIILFTS